MINLFPFLPLDGGHIFWAWSRRSAGAGSVAGDGARLAVGFVLVLLLFAIGLSNDIGKLTGPGIHLR